MPTTYHGTTDQRKLSSCLALHDSAKRTITINRIDTISLFKFWRRSSVQLLCCNTVERPRLAESRQYLLMYQDITKITQKSQPRPKSNPLDHQYPSQRSSSIHRRCHEPFISYSQTRAIEPWITLVSLAPGVSCYATPRPIWLCRFPDTAMLWPDGKRINLSQSQVEA